MAVTRGRIAVLLALTALIVGTALYVLPKRRPGPADPATSGADRPDIVLVTIDTFRADRLGRGFTPAIDAVAARGVRFTHARTTVPLTLPAHASLMTAQLPAAHGVRENGGTLPKEAPRLASILKSAGYATGGFVGAFVLDRRFGLAEGFDRYDDGVRRDPRAMDRLEAERPGADVVDAALAWLSTVRSSFFLWVHLYDPHIPYAPPDEFRRRAGGDAYNGEIAYADAQLSRLLAAIAARGADGEPIVAVLGDHGEGLGEHGERTHGMLAYDSTLRIPLVLAGPGVPPGLVDAPVSIVDVMPTLLRLAGGMTLTARADGHDLLRTRRADRDVVGETIYPRAAGWHPLSVLAGERWKLIKSSELELYDVAADPSESTNVAASHAGIVQGMSARLGDLSAGAPTPALDPAAAERLRALGYVSGGAAPLDPGAPNPARVIDAWTAFETALGQVSSGSPAEGLPALRELTSRFPSASLFVGTLGRALLEAGHEREAVRVYRAAVERHPQDASLFHDLAVAARSAGDAEEALRAEQAALALNANHPAALNGLGLLHADAGRTADAVDAFARAAAADPSNASYWTNLGNARRAAGDHGGAERSYERALEADPTYPDALNGLGVLLVQRRSASAAVPFFTRALERAPDFHEARLNLGIAYQESGDATRAAETYRRLLATAPASATRERAAARDLLTRLEKGRGG